jgi:hypothetical protein
VPDCGMAHATVSKTEESAHKQIENQDSDDYFVRFLWGIS